MPPEIPKTISPGHVVSFRCWLLAGIVFVYLVCGSLVPFLGNGMAGQIAWQSFGLPYNNSLLRYAVGLGLLGCFVWAGSRWIDPASGRRKSGPLARVRETFLLHR